MSDYLGPFIVGCLVGVGLHASKTAGKLLIKHTIKPSEPACCEGNHPQGGKDA